MWSQITSSQADLQQDNWVSHFSSFSEQTLWSCYDNIHKYRAGINNYASTIRVLSSQMNHYNA